MYFKQRKNNYSSSRRKFIAEICVANDFVILKSKILVGGPHIRISFVRMNRTLLCSSRWACQLRPLQASSKLCWPFFSLFRDICLAVGKGKINRMCGGWRFGGRHCTFFITRIIQLFKIHRFKRNRESRIKMLRKKIWKLKIISGNVALLLRAHMVKQKRKKYARMAVETMLLICSNAANKRTIAVIVSQLW